MNKKVTIIIPTFSRANYIERAINSVLNQDYSNYEIIVVDDNDSNSAARENMENIMQQYKDNNNIKYIKHKNNKNGAAARNTGIKNATGDYITFLDDDDIFMSDRLRKCVEVLENNRDYGAVYTSVIIIKNGKFVSHISADKKGNFIKETLLRKPIIGTGSNMFFRKEVVKSIGLFDESFIRHQDLEYLVRFFQKYNIINLSDYLVIKDESDRTNVVNLEKTIKCRMHFLNKFKDEINDLSINNDILYNNYVSLAMYSLYNRNYNFFKKMKFEASKLRKNHVKVKIKYLLGFITGYVDLLKLRNIISNIGLRRKMNNVVEREVRKSL